MGIPQFFAFRFEKQDSFGAVGGVGVKGSVVAVERVDQADERSEDCGFTRWVEVLFVHWAEQALARKRSDLEPWVLNDDQRRQPRALFIPFAVRATRRNRLADHVRKTNVRTWLGAESDGCLGARFIPRHAAAQRVAVAHEAAAGAIAAAGQEVLREAVIWDEVKGVFA